jgi:hypothetical protein
MPSQSLTDAMRAARFQFDLKVRDTLIARPDLSYQQIGRLFSVSRDVIVRVAQQFGYRRKTGPKPQKGSI